MQKYALRDLLADALASNDIHEHTAGEADY